MSDAEKLAELRARVFKAMERGLISAPEQLAILTHSKRKEDREGAKAALEGLENSIADIEAGNWT